MKHFIINSFRTVVYVAYGLIIAGAVALAARQEGLAAYELLGIEGPLARVLEIGVGALVGWVAATIVCGLIMTILDIRDDINDRLPDAREDL